jgi:hypothetical protein
MRDPQFFIAGDVEIPDDVTEIMLVTPLSRYDFVTIEIGPDDKLNVRVIPVEDLQEFDGVLFQADTGFEENTVVLRQVDLNFWPFSETDEDETDEDEDGDEDGGNDDGDESDEGTTGLRPFKVVNAEWWEDYMRKHRRG